jgi:tRNA nucleotidyltransferase (CCA-adding enzyme)
VKTLVELHMVRFEIQRKPLRRWLSRLGKETLMKLIALQEGDMGSKGTGKGNDGTYFSDLRCLLEELDQENSCLSLKNLAVNGKDLLELGYRPGKELGKCLQDLLDQVIDETLPNDPAVLLAEAEKKLSLPTKQ